jgi:hypothetical protein
VRALTHLGRPVSVEFLGCSAGLFCGCPGCMRMPCTLIKNYEFAN